MTTSRKTILANDHFYHVFSRGIDRRPTFTTKWELKRAIETLKYYRFRNLTLKLSQYLNLPEIERQKTSQELVKKDEKLVEIVAFCIMPNHFHFLLKQVQNNGISRFVANFTNSYTKYFNTIHQRNGPLFEGLFKAVLVETDEQFVHLSRYIHLNPVASLLVDEARLEEYRWSSLQEYLRKTSESICTKDYILSFFKSINEYRKFLLDQVAYVQQLEKIKHLLIE